MTAHRVALLLLLAPILALAQIPPQCDVTYVLTPYSLAFLGPSREALIGGINYSFHRFGNANTTTPALVLIPGLGGIKYLWPLEMLTEISKTREVLIFDNMLAGASVDTKANLRNLPLTIGDMAKSTVQLIATQNFTTVPDILGMSMGGMIAQWMAAYHGSSVGSLIVVSSSFGGKDAPAPPGGFDAMLTYLGSGESYNDVTLVLPLGVDDPAYCPLARDTTSLTFAADPSFAFSGPGAGYGWASGLFTSTAAFAVTNATRAKQAEAIRKFVKGPSLLPRLASGTNQIMWLGGAKDRIFPISTQSIAVAAVPSSWLVVVPDGGHGVSFQHVPQFTQQVKTFLDSAQVLDPSTPRNWAPAPVNGASTSAVSMAGGLVMAAAAAVLIGFA